MDKLIQHLQEIGVLKSSLIIEAFRNTDRAKFTPEDMRQWAYIDETLSIGMGQTISQPYTVAFMLELLEPKPGDKILDIGSGSGWQTALLAHIAGGGSSAGGKVIGMEIVPELCKSGKKNIDNFIKEGTVEWLCQDASKGLPEEAPFDKIIAAASLAESGRAASIDSVPQEWKDQLKVGGRMVVPIKNSIWLFVKINENDFEEKEFPGFAFVPFVGND